MLWLNENLNTPLHNPYNDKKNIKTVDHAIFSLMVVTNQMNKLVSTIM